MATVSYTHLDVYKRQGLQRGNQSMADFVIGDDFFFMGRKHCVLALVARHHHVYGLSLIHI